MNIFTWNVNGLRAALKNGFMDWFLSANADIVCLQETRLLPEELPASVSFPEAYHLSWNPAEKRGYSGTATISKEVPESVYGIGLEEFDSEGRVQILNYKKFTLINTYWPNSQDERKRLPYKLAFAEAIGSKMDALVKEGKHVILCGDYNIAHEPIDLARPKQNENSAGYYIEEREAMTTFLGRGYTDVFRALYPEEVKYTWWSYRGGARAKNVGWRLDYHCVNTAFMPFVKDICIHDDVTGSDHCPVELLLKDFQGRRTK